MLFLEAGGQVEAAEALKLEILWPSTFIGWEGLDVAAFPKGLMTSSLLAWYPQESYCLGGPHFPGMWGRAECW